MSIFTFEKRNEILLIVLLSISSVFMGLYKTSYLPNLKGFFSSLTTPVLSSISSLLSYVGSVMSEFGSIQDLKRKIGTLENENMKLKSELIKLKVVSVENKKYKKIVKLINEYPYLLYSRVIYRDPSNISCYITVDRGKRDGVEKGMSVIGFQNGSIALLGRVEEVSLNTSKIALITDRNLYVSVVLENGGFLGIMHGRGANNQFCVVEYVDASASVFHGERVLTSGMSDVYPGGLVVGKIVGVSKSKTSFFQTVYLKPEIDMMRDFDVFIVMKTNIASASEEESSESTNMGKTNTNEFNSLGEQMWI